MPSKVYEYVILHHPKAKDSKNGERHEQSSTLIVDVTRVVAKEEQVVAMLAARAIPDAFTDRLDEVEIAIRPF
jgi:hypothetical protein